jgi:hypothetical protein
MAAWRGGAIAVLIFLAAPAGSSRIAAPPLDFDEGYYLAQQARWQLAAHEVLLSGGGAGRAAAPTSCSANVPL